MSFFSRWISRKKKTVSKPVVARKPASELIDLTGEDSGYNPYDTVPGVPREKFGMRRQEDDKWSF